MLITFNRVIKKEFIMEFSEKLLRNNKQWVENQLKTNPDFFEKSENRQNPEYLWIGCIDNHISVNEITNSKANEIFVHKNIANMVVRTDMNFQSALSYSVDILKVNNIIICGHYDCDCINRALKNERNGLMNNWLHHVKDIYRLYQDELDAIHDATEKARRFVEINVEEQVIELSKSSIIQNAWKNGRLIKLHGWVYDKHKGIIKNLNIIYPFGNSQSN